MQGPLAKDDSLAGVTAHWGHYDTTSTTNINVCDYPESRPGGPTLFEHGAPPPHRV